MRYGACGAEFDTPGGVFLNLCNEGMREWMMWMIWMMRGMMGKGGGDGWMADTHNNSCIYLVIFLVCLCSLFFVLSLQADEAFLILAVCVIVVLKKICFSHEFKNLDCAFNVDIAFITIPDIYYMSEG